MPGVEALGCRSPTHLPTFLLPCSHEALGVRDRLGLEIKEGLYLLHDDNVDEIHQHED